MPSLESPALARTIDCGIAGGLVANLAWTTWHLGGALAGPMAWSFVAMMGLLAAVVVRRGMGATRVWPRGWWWPLPFLVYVVVQVTWWGETPGRGWLDGLNWVWLAAGFWVSLQVMAEPAARRVVWTGVAGVTLGLVVMAGYQRLGDPTWLPTDRTQLPQFWERSGGAFGAPASLAGWMILVLPLAGAMGRARPGRSRWVRGVAGLVLIGGGGALLWTYSRGGWMALAGALMIWPLLDSRATGRARLRHTLLVMGGIGLIGVGVYFTLPKAKERIDRLMVQSGELTRPILWRAAWGNLQSHPWLGTGGGSYEVMLERHRPIRFWDETKWAHNDYLNTLSDYGLVGFLLFFGGGAAVVGWQVRGRRSRLRASVEPEAAGVTETQALAVGGIALGLGLFIDFHLKVPALSLLAAIMGADWLTLMDRKNGSGSEGSSIPMSAWTRVGRVGAAMGILGFGLAVAAPKFQAEGLRFWAREKIDQAAPIEEVIALQAAVLPSLAPLERAAKLFPGSEKIWSDLAYARALQANWEPEKAAQHGMDAEAAARRALALCDQDWQSWVRLGTALDLQDRWGEAGLAFGQAVKIASNSTSAWYYQAFHLSLKPAARPVAEAALATCLRLDPWNPDAEALKASFERDRP